jgi:hypothetical protein
MKNIWAALSTLKYLLYRQITFRNEMVTAVSSPKRDGDASTRPSFSPMLNASAPQCFLERIP